MNNARRKEIANEYLARNNGDAQSAFDELTSFLLSPLPVEEEKFIYHCEARMILKKKVNKIKGE